MTHRTGAASSIARRGKIVKTIPCPSLSQRYVFTPRRGADPQKALDCLRGLIWIKIRCEETRDISKSPTPSPGALNNRGFFLPYRSAWRLQHMKAFLTRHTAAGAALLLFGLTPALADVRITASNGGEVLAYIQFFTLVDRSGERVILDGPCLSACTLVLSAIPRERICVTPRAVLGFHAAQVLDTRTRKRYPATAATRVLEATYPPRVRAWIEEHGGLTSKVIMLRGRELVSLYVPCARARGFRP
jgi:hypothetical protein